jgi:hypothetical protein
MFAVEHFGLFLKDVAVAVNFHEVLLDEFFVDGAFGAGVIVKASFPPAEEFGDFGVVAVRKLLGANVLFHGLHLYGGAMSVGAANHQDIFAL